MTTVRPVSRFGMLDLDADGRVKRFAEKPQAEGWINAGYFVFHRRVFDYLDGGDACIMEHEPLERLAADGQMVAYRHEGFFFAMDTYREYEALKACGTRDKPRGKSGNEHRRLVQGVCRPLGVRHRTHGLQGLVAGDLAARAWGRR